MGSGLSNSNINDNVEVIHEEAPVIKKSLKPKVIKTTTTTNTNNNKDIIKIVPKNSTRANDEDYHISSIHEPPDTEKSHKGSEKGFSVKPNNHISEINVSPLKRKQTNQTNDLNDDNETETILLTNNNNNNKNNSPRRLKQRINSTENNTSNNGRVAVQRNQLINPATMTSKSTSNATSNLTKKLFSYNNNSGDEVMEFSVDDNRLNTPSKSNKQQQLGSNSKHSSSSHIFGSSTKKFSSMFVSR